jgi:acyl carrier protein
VIAETSTYAAVRAIVEGVAGRGRTPEHVTPDTRLHEGFWLDSMELLEVVIACEQQFDIVFEESTDLTPDALATIGSLAALVAERQARSAV